MALYAQETYVNATEGYSYDETPVFETFTESMGELYRASMVQYGRCIGRVYAYVNGKDGTPIGWVFVKRATYEDTGKSYLQETWVTVHTAPPTKSIEYHYA